MGEELVRQEGSYGVVNFEDYAMNVESLVRQVGLIQSVMEKVMKDGEHYGKIPGTNKPTLLKPGAEKLCMVFRLEPNYEIIREFREDLFIAYNEKLGIVCMPDLEGFFPGHTVLSVGDIKSGAMQPWTKYQTAFQKLAIGEYRTRFGLNLRKDGKYKVEWHNDRSDEAVILDELRKYRQEGTEL